MGKPAARISDIHVCPMITVLVPHVGGPVIGPGVPTVLIGGMPAAVVGDMCVCTGPPDVIAMGSTGVFIGGKPAARMGDITAHGGTIVAGLPTVLIGEVAGAGVEGVAPMPLDFLSAMIDAIFEAAENGAKWIEKPGVPGGNQKKKDPPSKIEKEKISFRLLDQEGNPVEGEKCEVTLPDGSVIKTATDKQGQVLIDNLDPGLCSISFTEIHDEEWG